MSGFRIRSARQAVGAERRDQAAGRVRRTARSVRPGQRHRARGDARVDQIARRRRDRHDRDRDRRRGPHDRRADAPGDVVVEHDGRPRRPPAHSTPCVERAGAAPDQHHLAGQAPAGGAPAAMQPSAVDAAVPVLASGSVPRGRRGGSAACRVACSRSPRPSGDTVKTVSCDVACCRTTRCRSPCRRRRERRPSRGRRRRCCRSTRRRPCRRPRARSRRERSDTAATC